MIRNLLFLLLSAFILSSCMHSKRLEVLKPADITVNPDIKTIVLVNRYKPAKQNQWINIMEGIFSGEFLFTDRRGAENALAGLSDELKNSPRYKIVMANQYLEGSGIGFFPEPLPTQKINELCKQFNADAVLAIEAFDSDIALMVQPLQRRRRVNRVEVVQQYFQANEKVRVTMGWRLYQSGNGAIIDQHQMYNEKQFSAEGQTDFQAKGNLLNPEQAVMRTAFDGGVIYSNRIAARWSWITREYYTRAKGVERMKEAAKLADNGNWERAATIWLQVATSPDPKIAGRACYNMAVASEVLGKPEIAMEWAEKAANKHNNANARQYVLVLRQRLNELQRLDVQMDNAAKE